MNIQETLSTVSPYFKELKNVDDYNILSFIFKSKWGVKKLKEDEIVDEEILIETQPIDTENKNYIFGSKTKTFDEMIDFIKLNIIEYNLEIEKKEILLRKKVEELKVLFKESPIEKLESLSFITNNDENLNLKN